MALQTFTAGQVLTAAQVNALQANDYNQTVSTKTGDYVLVAADKGTRVVMNSASAQTITVNTSLFSAGDTLFIQNIGAGICTITAGTATVSTAGSLALAQNAGGTLYFTSTGVSIFFPTVAAAASTSGLTLINTTTFTNVASVSLPDGTFNSTYANYRIVTDFQALTSGADTSMRVRASGTDLTTSTYNYGRIFVGVYSSVALGSENNLTATFINIGSTRTTVGVGGNFNLDIHAPMLARRTSVMGGGVGSAVNLTGAIVDNATAYDSLTFFVTGENITGTIRAYGYQN